MYGTVWDELRELSEASCAALHGSGAARRRMGTLGLAPPPGKGGVGKGKGKAKKANKARQLREKRGKGGINSSSTGKRGARRRVVDMGEREGKGRGDLPYATCQTGGCGGRSVPAASFDFSSAVLVMLACWLLVGGIAAVGVARRVGCCPEHLLPRRPGAPGRGRTGEQVEVPVWYLSVAMVW
ncbi:hypothetical protein GGR56DRAFT_300232 [Xylariaceae sp. FL0804]|nr:hypothetical protein GGR56DRAFT_300232 [Xylariaceae sp. FL0804]